MNKEHLNIHDPHNQYTWADDRLPWWLPYLKGLGAIALGLGVVTGFYFFTGVMLELEGVRR